MRLRACLLGCLALWASSGWGADSRASQYFEDALTRYEKQDLDGAIIQLKNALQVDNGMLAVHLLLGKALLENGEVAAAEVALLEALRLGVNRAEIVPLLGQAYLAQGKHKLILEQPYFNLNGLPTVARRQVLLLRSAAAAELGNLREAQAAIEEARVIDPSAPEVWLAEVPFRIRALQFREARAAVERALALKPDSIEAWRQRASVEHAVGNLSEALDAYKRVIDQQPGNLEVRIARAGLFIDLGRNPDAAKELEAIRSLSRKEDPRAAYLRALLAEREGKREDARAALRDVTELIDPVPLDFIRYRPQVLMLNGLAHFGLDQREKARVYLEAFHRVQGNTAASKLLAQVYLKENKPERAADVLETYLRARPGDGQAMILIAAALMQRGQHARAVTFMKQALQSRDAPEYRTVLGFGLLRGGQAASAIPELEAALKLNPGQSQAATTLIQLYLRSGQIAKATAHAEKLVKQHPRIAEHYDLLGVAKREAGDVAAARSAFEQALKHDGNLASAKLNLARIEIAEKAYAAASARLEAVLKGDGNNTEAMFALATIAELQGRLPDAQRWLEKAIDTAGTREVRWPLALADFYLRHGRANLALDAAKLASSRAPEDLNVLFALAQVSLANNDLSGARSSLTTATRVAEYNPGMQFRIAQLQLAANHPAGAAYSLEKALTSQPGFLPAQSLMTQVELRMGEVAKADKRARELAMRFPQRAIGHGLLAEVALARGNRNEALELFRRAHRVEPSSQTLIGLFRLLSESDEKSALLMAEQWLKNHPKDAAVGKTLADQYARSGNYQRARGHYDTLLKSSPEDSNLHNSLANVLLRLNDPGAIRHAERAVALNPNNALAIDTLGWILLRQAEVDRALPLLREARLRRPENPEIRYHLAVALQKSGRIGDARLELAEALRSGVAFDGIEEARRLEQQLR